MTIKLFNLYENIGNTNGYKKKFEGSSLNDTHVIFYYNHLYILDSYDELICFAGSNNLIIEWL